MTGIILPLVLNQPMHVITDWAFNIFSEGKFHSICSFLNVCHNVILFCIVSAVVVYHFSHSVQRMWHTCVQTVTEKLVCSSVPLWSLGEVVGGHIREEQIMTFTMGDQAMIMCHHQMTENS